MNGYPSANNMNQPGGQSPWGAQPNQGPQPQQGYPQQPSQHNIQLVKAKEAKKLSAKLRSDDYVIALCINAEQLSSEELAALFKEQQQTGTKRLVFVIGGSHGLDESIIARAQRRLSVSKMTFPHQLARLILAEQLYRAQKINSKEPYHK